MSYDSPDSITDGVRLKVIKSWLFQEKRAWILSVARSAAASNSNYHFVPQAEVTDPQVNSHYPPPASGTVVAVALSSALSPLTFPPPVPEF